MSSPGSASILRNPGPAAARPGRIASFIRRHPLLTFLLVFNTAGQAVAFVPVVARRFYGIELDSWC